MKTLSCSSLVLLLCILATVAVPALVPLADAQGNSGVFEKDLAECRYEALKHTQPSSMTSLRGVLHEDELILRCMEARGYRREVYAPSTDPAPPNPRPQPEDKTPQTSDDYYKLGLDCYKKHYYMDAMEAFDQAIELDHENADAYFQLGLVHYQLGHSKEAFLMLDRLEKLDSEKANELLNIIWRSKK
jgi:tetratricopeptide (TPR) repeat protein